MKLAIDGDLYLYRICCTAEREADFGDGIVALWSDVREVVGRLEMDIADITSRFDTKPRDVILAFSDHVNWRKLINPQYKSNRRGVRKPLAYYAARDWCVKNLQTLIMPHLEADDVLGILVTEHPEIIAVTGDKDALTVPSQLFNPDRDLFPRVITLEDADRAFFRQALTGDATDGYAGVPGVGPVRAGKILDPLPHDPAILWQAVLQTYIDHDLTEADAILNARMARICRAGDWDHERKEMTWTPPKPPAPPSSSESDTASSKAKRPSRTSSKKPSDTSSRRRASPFTPSVRR